MASSRFSFALTLGLQRQVREMWNLLQPGSGFGAGAGTALGGAWTAPKPWLQPGGKSQSCQGFVQGMGGFRQLGPPGGSSEGEVPVVVRPL